MIIHSFCIFGRPNKDVVFGAGDLTVVVLSLGPVELAIKPVDFRLQLLELLLVVVV